MSGQVGLHIETLSHQIKKKKKVRTVLNLYLILEYFKVFLQQVDSIELAGAEYCIEFYFYATSPLIFP